MNIAPATVRWPIIALGFFCAPLSAADFRTLDFGSACAAVQELEAAIGSRPMPGASNPNVQAFKGRAFDRDASIVYVCKDGKLAAGNYFFPGQHFDSALRNLHDVYDTLSGKYGAPFINHSPWQVGPSKDTTLIASDPSTYSVTWRSERIDTTISLVSNGDALGADWEVMVVQSPGTL
jgi:hypothetical protein